MDTTALRVIVYYQLGYSYCEIAELTGLKDVTVKAIVATARHDGVHNAYRVDRTFKEIGNELGISDTVAHNAYKSGMAKLVRMLEGDKDDILEVLNNEGS